MDNGYRFEELINSFIGRPDYVTYATNWADKNDRVALLFTACIIQYDKNSAGKIGEKLEYYMKELFNDPEDKKVSLECLKFLEALKSNIISE